jgi:hypothetical protein
VGRKQFSKSILEQLPKRELVSWRDEIEAAEHDGIPDSLAVDGDIWGHVVGASWSDGSSSNWTARWVIFVKDAVLYKHLDIISVSGLLKHCGAMEDNWQTRRYTNVKTIHAKLIYLRESVKGWMDQLFIGV